MSTTVANERWESGSEFHWPPPVLASTTGDSLRTDLVVGSGRDALRIIVMQGVRTRGWQRLWVPEYLCQEVVAAVCGLVPRVESYRDHPLLAVPPLPAATRGDVVLCVNYFGLRGGFPELPEGVEVIEDHTHDPTSNWAHRSVADYCVASMRKVFPVPDGGVAWSPRGHPLPEQPAATPRHEEASSAKLAAMVLKGLYLRGGSVAKSAFRALAVAGEADIAVGDSSGPSAFTTAVLTAVVAREWRMLRRNNWHFLVSRLTGIAGLRVLAPWVDDAVAFSCVLLLESSAQRDRLCSALIDANVYPAILWRLDDSVLPVSDDIRALASRMMSVHCDGRYSERDLERVATLIRQYGAR